MLKSSKNQPQPLLDIYLPSHFLFCSCHYFIGFYSYEQMHYQINYIFAISCQEMPQDLYSNAKKLHNIIEQLSVSDSGDKVYHVGCLGLILDLDHKNHLQKYKNILLHMENKINIIFQTHNHEVVNITYMQLNGIDITYKCQTRVILYSCSEVLSSQLIPSLETDAGSLQYELHKPIFISLLSKLRKMSKKNKIIKNLFEKEGTTNVTFPLEKENFNIFICIIILAFNAMIYIVKIYLKACSFLYTRIPADLEKIMLQTAIGRQTSRRLYQLSWLSETLNQNHTVSLRCGNLISAILLDVAAGSLATYLIIHYAHLPLLFETSVMYADEVVNKLQKLLQWLMGVPAGLKLNYPLSSALGHFFLYHIYLWKTYMIIIKPLFAFVMESLAILGVLGLTFLLSLFSDLISLATIHIYCFYGYAARLYGFQVFGLTSLWRLFRGKKWNPLRHRTDSFTYDIYQLFIGTLLFTVLFFLLPTVLIYYVVFSMLRIAILAVQGAITRSIHVLSIFPLYSVILWSFSSAKTAGSMHFTYSNQNNDTKTVVLNMKIMHSSLFSLIAQTVPEDNYQRASVVSLSWKSLFHSLLWGNIIYPI